MQPITTNSSFLAIPKEGLAHPTVEQQKVQLKAQVEEFATVLYAEMFQEMREAGKSDEDEENSVFGGGDTNMFMHFVDEQVGRNFSKQGGNALTDALYKQLASRLDTQATQQQGGGGQ
jgi:Rod binding domain-containing protein